VPCTIHTTILTIKRDRTNGSECGSALPLLAPLFRAVGVYVETQRNNISILPILFSATGEQCRNQDLYSFPPASCERVGSGYEATAHGRIDVVPFPTVPNRLISRLTSWASPLHARCSEGRCVVYGPRSWRGGVAFVSHWLTLRMSTFPLLRLRLLTALCPPLSRYSSVLAP
jgi:hypothetical protein